MTAFLDSRLDAKYTDGAQIIATNPGRIKTYTEGGDLMQKFTRSAPTHQVELCHPLKTSAEFKTLIDLWYVVNFTPYTGFRVKVHSDYQATLVNSKCTFSTGSTTVLQLQRAHTFGSITVLRDIYKPVSSTVTVYRTRSAVQSSIASTVDYATGLATISGHTTGDTYVWVGEFDLPMTFADNEWAGTMRISNPRLHIEPDTIKLEELPRAAAVA